MNKGARLIYKLLLILLVTVPLSYGQALNQQPDETQNYLYFSSNVLNAKHTVSTGFWNSLHQVGLNMTVSYYTNILVEGHILDRVDEPLGVKGPTFYSIATSFRYKAELETGAFSGLGLSFNRLLHGNNIEYDNELSFSTFLARPRCSNVQFEYPYSSLLIEGGYTFSNHNVPVVFTALIAWHPMVMEFWQQNDNWEAKGYFTPYNIQLRVELGLKKIFRKDIE